VEGYLAAAPGEAPRGASPGGTRPARGDNFPNTGGRLERQALIYGFEDDLAVLSLSSNERVLDAGCGAGSITRAIAQDNPNGTAIGVDLDPKFIDYAKRKTASEGIENIDFKVGDVLNLPFEDDHFDVVWSKHLLQWVGERQQAIKEFKRVLKPNGRLICCNFDGFGEDHYPVDVELHQHLVTWFEAAAEALGFDNRVGRKLPSMFLDAGFTDVTVDIMQDRAFGGFGGDPEKKWNWEVQFQNAIGFSAQVYGSMDRAKEIAQSCVDLFDRSDVYVHCVLFYVEGRKP
jgi:ubiquinone/menaquinone biosynthesis C-methylase UbiE